MNDFSDGSVLVLRTCGPDMKSCRGFVWPTSGPVECPDWNLAAECGGGLHGLLWGEGDGDLLNWGAAAKWLVVRITEFVDLGEKIKFPRGEVVHCGDRQSATECIHARRPGAIVGITLTGGDRSTLTGGDRSTLTGGDGSTLTGGNWSTLTGGYRSTLTGGDGAKLTGGNWSTLTGGYGSTLTGGYGSTLTGGVRSKLTGGDWSKLTGGDWSKLTGGDRSTLTGGYRSTLTGGDVATLTGGYGATLIFSGCGSRTAVVGKNGIRPNVPYRLNDSFEIVEVA